jgi:hypothetical protein
MATNVTVNAGQGSTQVTVITGEGSTSYSVSTGSRGPAGATGATGAQGDRAGLKYTFDDQTGAGAPSPGHLKFNSSTLSAVTRISIRDTDFDGSNTSALLSLIDDSTSTIKARVVIRSNSNADASHFNFLVTSVTDEGNHHHINGTYVSGSAFAANEIVTFDFYQTGDKGETGPNSVTTSTSSNLTGFISANGTAVSGATAGATAATANTLALRDATGGSNFAAVGASSVTSSGAISTTGASASIGTGGATGIIYTLGSDANIYTAGANATIYTQGANASIFTSGQYAGISTSGANAIISTSGADASISTLGANASISTLGANASISTVGDIATISTTGQEGRISTSGELASIGTSGNSAEIFTTGTEANIYTVGAAAHIFTAAANAYIQSRSTFKLSNGTYTTTLSHSPTADRAIEFPNKAGTVAMIDAETHTGAHAFSSTTRPTSAGTGTPAATSLITLTDLIGRGGRRLSAQLVADEAGNDNTTTLKTSATLTLALEIGLYHIESLIVVSGGALFVTVGTRQKLAFTGTGTFSGAQTYNSQNGAAASTTYPTTRAANAVDAEILFGANSSATLRHGTLNVTVAGNLVVQWAQRTAGVGSSPTLNPPSYIRAQRIS